MAASKNKLILSVIVPCVIFLSSTSYAAGLNSDSDKIKTYLDKEYYVILFGFVFYLPEIVHFSLSDNGTFSLSSDLFTKPVQGTYENNIFLLKGEGTTGKFLDSEWDNIEMTYQFTSLPIGLRGFFITGVGKREITFFEEDEEDWQVPEPFIFMGPGY